MENQPLVSVCMPIYNNPKGLANTLDLITGQTYRNLEIIISDNCSSDQMVEKIAFDFFMEDSRIRYWRQSHNIGIDNNYRFVIDHATGKYFMFAQDDDWWSRNFIEVLVDELEKNPGVTVAAGQSQYKGTNGKLSEVRPLDNISVYNVVGNGSHGFACMGLWNREDFLKYEVRLPIYVLGGDHITVAHALLGSGKGVAVNSRVSYIKGYREGRFQICFNNDFWYSFRSWYWLMKTLSLSKNVPTLRKALLPLIAITNFGRACAITTVQIIVSLPENNPLRKKVQQMFFGAN